MTRPYIFTPKFNLSLRLTSSCIDKSACGIQTARHCTSVSESFSEIMKLSAPSRPRPPGYYYSRASTVLYGVMLRVCLSVVSVLNWLHVQIVSLRSELIWFGLLDVSFIVLYMQFRDEFFCCTNYHALQIFLCYLYCTQNTPTQLIFKGKTSHPPKIHNGANVAQLRFTNAMFCFDFISEIKIYL